MRRKHIYILVSLLISILVLSVYSFFMFNLDMFLPDSKGAPVFVAPGCPGCNLILISLDTLRSDRLGAYGYAGNTSPNLDSFAKKSILFTHSYSNGYYTLPSHMSIFTGLYPLSHKVNTPEDLPLSDDCITIAEQLKSRGFRTIWSGPLNDQNLNLSQGFGRGFDEFHSGIFTRDGFDAGMIGSLPDGQFFLFLHSYTDHAPYIYPAEFNSRFTDRGYKGTLPGDFGSLRHLQAARVSEDIKNQDFFQGTNLTLAVKEALIRDGQDTLALEKYIGNMSLPVRYHPQFIFYASIPEPDSRDLAQISGMYDDGVYFTDYQFGQLLSSLENKGLMDKTVIVVTSDHGEELYEHGGWDHANFYEHTINVPLMIYLPDSQGARIDGLAEAVDIYPMLSYIFGLEMPAQGKNLLDKSQGNRFVYGYTLGSAYIRSRSWKYISGPGGEEGFYYLPSDPGENNNLIASKNVIHRLVLGRLKQELGRWSLEQV